MIFPFQNVYNNFIISLVFEFGKESAYYINTIQYKYLIRYIKLDFSIRKWVPGWDFVGLGSMFLAVDRTTVRGTRKVTILAQLSQQFGQISMTWAHRRCKPKRPQKLVCLSPISGSRLVLCSTSRISLRVVHGMTAWLWSY